MRRAPLAARGGSRREAHRAVIKLENARSGTDGRCRKFLREIIGVSLFWANRSVGKNKGDDTRTRTQD